MLGGDARARALSFSHELLLFELKRLETFRLGALCCGLQPICPSSKRRWALSGFLAIATRAAPKRCSNVVNSADFMRALLSRRCRRPSGGILVIIRKMPRANSHKCVLHGSSGINPGAAPVLGIGVI